MVRLITPAQYRAMPWKNGGGVTTEIAVHPVGATMESFDWRVSVADVARDGPFSPFPGVDRTIVVIDGAGMRLSAEGGAPRLLGLFEPFAFAGEDAIDCALVGGPVRDFNAMCRRERAKAGVVAIRSAETKIAPADCCVIYAAAGSHECVASNGSPQVLAPGHALVVERVDNREAAPITVRPIGADAVALAVRIQYP